MAITATAVGTARPAAMRQGGYVVVSLGGLTLAMRADEAAYLARTLQAALVSTAAAVPLETSTDAPDSDSEG